MVFFFALRKYVKVGVIMDYIALFQRIKIGKHDKIKMIELEYLFKVLGFQDINVYYQNGNVVFKSDKSETEIRKLIEKEIIIRYHCTIPVIIRTIDDFKLVLLNCPFPEAKIEMANQIRAAELFIVFLKQAPKCIDCLQQFNAEYKVVQRELYILTRKVAANLLKHLTILDIHATVRDLRTVKKIINILNK